MNAYESSYMHEATGDTLRPGGFKLTEQAVHFCALNDRSRVLDLGCGMGATASYLYRQHGILTVGIDPSTGAITLRWRASNPAGTSNTGYIIRRRVGSTGAFDFVGVTGDKNFTDNSFIAGPDSVQYTVQGQRGGTLGPLSDILVINFGRVGPGLNGPQRDFTVEGGEKEDGSGENTGSASKQEAA